MTTHRGPRRPLPDGLTLVLAVIPLALCLVVVGAVVGVVAVAP